MASVYIYAKHITRVKDSEKDANNPNSLVLTGSKTSDTSCRSFLGQNNNIEMGYHLKN